MVLVCNLQIVSCWIAYSLTSRKTVLCHCKGWNHLPCIKWRYKIEECYSLQKDDYQIHLFHQNINFIVKSTNLTGRTETPHTTSCKMKPQAKSHKSKQQFIRSSADRAEQGALSVGENQVQWLHTSCWAFSCPYSTMSQTVAISPKSRTSY